MRWLPFVTGIILHFCFVGIGSYGLLGYRVMGLADSIDLQHCTPHGLERFQHSIELCAYDAASGYMNDSYFLARMFFLLTLLSITIGWFVSIWGQRNRNPMMYFVGCIAAILVFTWLERTALAAMAVFFGHSVGWLLVMRYRQ